MVKKHLSAVVFSLIAFAGTSFGTGLMDTTRSKTYIVFDAGMGVGQVSESQSRIAGIGFSITGKRWGGGIRLKLMSGGTGVDYGWFGPPVEKFSEKAVLAYRSIPVFKNHTFRLGAGYGMMEGDALNTDQTDLESIGSVSGLALEASLGNYSKLVGYNIGLNVNLNGSENYFGIIFSLVLTGR
ncbi:MAG: hypothetical protein ACKOQ6_02990 [Bacteroidota bacterium]